MYYLIFKGPLLTCKFDFYFLKVNLGFPFHDFQTPGQLPFLFGVTA